MESENFSGDIELIVERQVEYFAYHGVNVSKNDHAIIEIVKVWRFWYQPSFQWLIVECVLYYFPLSFPRKNVQQFRWLMHAEMYALYESDMSTWHEYNYPPFGCIN